MGHTDAANTNCNAIVKLSKPWEHLPNILYLQLITCIYNVLLIHFRKFADFLPSSTLRNVSPTTTFVYEVRDWNPRLWQNYRNNFVFLYYYNDKLWPYWMGKSDGNMSVIDHIAVWNRNILNPYIMISNWQIVREPYHLMYGDIA